MKNLKEYLSEDAAVAMGAATPANTMGAGNPMLPGLSDNPGDVNGSTAGSGDCIKGYCKKEKAKKKKKINTNESIFDC